jgi:hypothetical protein
MTGRNGDVEWPCYVVYTLPDVQPELRYQGKGYKGEHRDPELEAGFLNTHGSTPEELADRMRNFVAGMNSFQNKPLSGACLHTRWEHLSPDEERRFMDRLENPPKEEQPQEQ